MRLPKLPRIRLEHELVRGMALHSLGAGVTWHPGSGDITFTLDLWTSCLFVNLAVERT